MKVVVNPEPVKPKKVFGLRETIALRTEGNFTSRYVLHTSEFSFTDPNIYIFLHSRKVDLILRHIRDTSELGTNQRVLLRHFKQLFSSLTKTEIITFHDKNGQDST